MSERTTHRRPTAAEPASGWATGLAYFAGAVMILVGIFGVFEGIAAILKNDVYLVRGDYVFTWDLTTWGWLHLALGIVVALAGFAVFSGQPWARAVGIVLAGMSALANFMFLPYYPVWSLLIIALNILVIWALAVYSRRAAA
jgi:hypothetical protein